MHYVYTHIETTMIARWFSLFGQHWLNAFILSASYRKEWPSGTTRQHTLLGLALAFLGFKSAVYQFRKYIYTHVEIHAMQLCAPACYVSRLYTVYVVGLELDQICCHWALLRAACIPIPFVAPHQIQLAHTDIHRATPYIRILLTILSTAAAPNPCRAPKTLTSNAFISRSPRRHFFPRAASLAQQMRNVLFLRSRYAGIVVFVANHRNPHAISNEKSNIYIYILYSYIYVKLYSESQQLCRLEMEDRRILGEGAQIFVDNQIFTQLISDSSAIQ